MLPLSMALAKTGAAALATDAFLSFAGGAGPRLLLAALVAATIALTRRPWGLRGEASLSRAPG